MKYIIGSLIISFGVIFVALAVLVTLGIKAPDDILKYLGMAWIILAVATYPIAKRIMRD